MRGIITIKMMIVILSIASSQRLLNSHIGAGLRQAMRPNFGGSPPSSCRSVRDP
jgi:hypothetical protein